MAFNDAFGNFGHYSFSSKPTHGRSIYESISGNMGDSYNQDFGSNSSARLYANAMCMASAQYQLDRALNNRDPSKATEMLVALERDFQISPGYRDTLKQRRDFLSAVVRVSRGNSQAVIEEALSGVLGADFIEYRHLVTDAWPTDPELTSVFSLSGQPTKQFTLPQCIAKTNSIITVPFTVIGESEPPLAGESYTIDPDPTRTIEVVKIESVVPGQISALFTRAHEPGTIATRAYPFWSSYRRYSCVVVSLAASKNPEKRRKINDLMSRASRGVSQWAIVSNQGSFILDSATNGLLDGTSLA